MKRVGIVGCGWLGYRIAERLYGQYAVYTTTSSQDKVDDLTSKGFNPTVVRFSDDNITSHLHRWAAISNLDVVIITVPFSERNLLTNRFQNLFSFIGDFQGQLFYMSSTSVYPNAEHEYVEEDVNPSNVFGERTIKEKYPQINILRLAGLMGDQRLLRNYNITNLDQAVNHIHYTDICSVIQLMMERQLSSKLYNVVAPMHPAKAEVINAQNGHEYATESEVKGKIVSSLKLHTELGFFFEYPDPMYFHLPPRMKV